MSAPPLISVVVPLYNKRATVVRALRSVLAQSFADFELLVVADPSTDGSEAEAAMVEDPRIRRFARSAPGPGGYAARNFGIAEARGEWVAFLDADDEWLPGHLATISELIGRAGPLTMVSEGWTDVFAWGVTRPCGFAAAHRGQGPRRIGFKTYLDETAAGRTPFHTNVATVRKSALEAVGGFPAGKCTRGGDTALWLELMARYREALCSPTLGAVYHREASDITPALPEPGASDYVRDLMLRLLAAEPDPAVATSFRRYINRSVRLGALRQIKAGGLTGETASRYALPEGRAEKVLFSALALLPSPLQKAVAGLLIGVRNGVARARSR